MALIEKLKLDGYFLIVWDIVNFCRDHGILAQGRGSAANSAVCYALGITAVDPVGMDLLFERFLSEERGEWPDIDLDLPSGDQRERAIQYVYERYGKLGAAMTANVITYRGKSAAREVGKALGFELVTLDRLSSLVRAWEWKDPSDTPERHFRDADLDLKNPRVRKFLELYQSVQDLPRHLGQHSGGMVICQGQLDSVVPLEPATMPGRVVVQWDKEDCADMGIIKVDLLGLGMLAAIEECLVRIRESYGEEVDLAHLPADDPAVYGALQKADTIGMFQVESRAQMSCLPRLRPARFYDIVVQVAIIRPGPIVGKMVHPYLRRRQGRERADCLHPSLEPVLRADAGRAAVSGAVAAHGHDRGGVHGRAGGGTAARHGFQAVGKTHDARSRRSCARAWIATAFRGAVQDQIVLSITSFALYGFPESHAASFAMIAYASAYLKCHYLAAFTAALLNNQPMGFYHPSILIKDAQRHGLRVLPVDVTQSDWLCTHRRPPAFSAAGLSLRPGDAPAGGRSDRARTGLAAIRQRGRPGAARAGTAQRRDEDAGRSWRTESAAADPPARCVVDGGARGAAGGPLLERMEAAEGASPLARMTVEERLTSDFRGTGVTIGRHPMAYRRAEMQALGVTPAAYLARIPNGRLVRIAGSVIVRQRPGTAKGFVFLSMEDETGVMNAIITPATYDRYKLVVVGEPFLLIDGVLQNQDGVVSVKVGRVEALRAGAAAESHNFH